MCSHDVLSIHLPYLVGTHVLIDDKPGFVYSRASPVEDLRDDNDDDDDGGGGGGDGGGDDGVDNPDVMPVD